MLPTHHTQSLRGDFEADDYLLDTAVNSSTDQTLIDEYASEIGTHGYMPKTFAGLDTSKLGFFIVGQKSAYIELKNKIIKEAGSMSVEDRMQGVRYLCSIPYTNGTAHCLEAAMSIIRDGSIDIYKRFYFFSNKDKYFRLDDHLVYYIYGGFFKQGKREGPLKVPYELMFLTVAFILQNYSSEMDIRQSALNWCLDLVENDNEDDGTKVKALCILVQHGEHDEQSFAIEQCNELFNIEDPIDVEIDDNDVRDLLRALRTKHQLTQQDVGETSLDEGLYRTLINCVPGDKHTQQNIANFFEQVVDDSDLLYEGVHIKDICRLINRELATFEKWVATDCINNLIRIACDESIEGLDLIPQLIRTLTNFTQPLELKLAPSLEERLRNDVFAGLNQSLLRLNEGLKEEVNKSRQSSDKAAVREFLIYFEDEKDLLYKLYSNDMTKQKFEEHFNNITTEWMTA